MKHTEKYALLSVFDKTGIVEFARDLLKQGYSIISTGGTAKILTENNINVIPIQDITGNPESFDGRMKTISFQIESGILFDRTNRKHLKEANELKIKAIDIVVCNLYPFEKTIADKTVSIDTAVENIDVGGPTMIRAAAKNYKNVIVVVDPSDYVTITEAIKNKNDNENFRKELMSKAFYHLSFYDSQIAHYFSSEQFPQEFTLPGRKLMDLRYGENPHQKGAIYIEPNAKTPFKNLTQVSGRGLSLTNITDINAGLEVVRQFKEPTAVVIKHNTPCGIALGKTSEESLERAIDADPESAFGGVVVLNTTMTAKAAKIIASFKDSGRGMMDIISAPSFDNEAVAILTKVRKTTGLYSFGKTTKPQVGILQIKWIDGGFVMQDADNDVETGFENWEIVTKTKPTKKQMEQMQIGWKFITRIRSNSIIVIDKSLPMTRGIGSGQTSRVRSTKIALEQAANFAKGAILVGDSFFPFNDSVKIAIKHGIAAIVQQGGSIRDKDSVNATDEAGIPMIFTHRRAFWH